MAKPVYIDNGTLRDLGAALLECEALKVGVASGTPRIVVSYAASAPSASSSGSTLYATDDPFASGVTSLRYLKSDGTLVSLVPGGVVLPIGNANSAGTSLGWARADHVHDGLAASVVNVSSNHLYSATNGVILVNTASGGIDITLVNPTAARTVWVKKTAGANQLRLIPSGATNIEGANASYVLSAAGSSLRGFWALVFDGTNWWVGG